MNVDLYFKKDYTTDSFFFRKDLELASESVIAETSKRIANAVIKKFASVISKGGNSKIAAAIAKTKGDITKLVEYKNAKISLDALASMSRGGGYCSGVISDLELIHKWLIKNRETFATAYARKQQIVAAFYTSAAAIWLVGINYAILTLTNVYKGDVTWNKMASTRLLEKPHFKRVRELAEKINNGSINSAIKAGQKDAMAEESATIVGIILGAVAGIFILIYFIRYAIYLFLSWRVNISDWLKSESYFAKVIAANNTKITPKQQKEQLEYSKKLEELANTIDVDLSDEDAEIEKSVQADKLALSREISIATKQEQEQAQDTIGYGNSGTAVGGNVAALNF